MPRFARVVATGCPHHITQRGNNRQTVFRNDQDCKGYLYLLSESAERFQLKLLGYCLMPNHVHLIATPEHPDSMAVTLRRTHAEYARRFNETSQRCGHLWQNRFYTCAMDENHLWTALRYVERNPVRARLADRPDQWRWSSAASHMTGRPDPFCRLDGEVWTYRYRPDPWPDFLLQENDREAEELRSQTRTGRPWGSEQFVSELSAQFGPKVLKHPVGRPKSENRDGHPFSISR